MRNEGFYVVWCPTTGAPRVRHDSLEKADAEAKRLARQNPLHEFFVLAAIQHVVVDNLRVTTLVPPDEMETPF